MSNKYTILDTFDYTAEAQVVKLRLEMERIQVFLVDEKTIDSDPLTSQAIGGVKLQVFTEDVERAMIIYNEIRTYARDIDENPIFCTACNSSKTLAAPRERKNIFYMLFPFFEKTRYVCLDCKKVFKYQKTHLSIK